MSQGLGACIVHSLGRLGVLSTRLTPTHHAGVLPAADALELLSVVYAPAVRPVPISPGALLTSAAYTV